MVSVPAQIPVPSVDSPAVFGPPFNTESYDRIYDNPFLSVRQNPLSTFSIDVDTAAYANVRRFINQGLLPPKDAVRIEELVNYFPYDYATPTDGKPFVVHVEMSACPWKPGHRLARIALRGKDVSRQERPAVNLVFLLDVSGSMAEPNKLPFVKSAMHLLLQSLTERDRVAIVVYAGASGLVLPSTPCSQPETILAAVDQLQAAGSTAGGAGIQMAYEVAAENYASNCINRIILCTDGDFNVGISDRGSLVRFVEEKARSGIYLTVLGFGMGNYKDSMLESLADKGHGNYGYIDTIQEARKMLVEQVEGTMVPIAKDVKIQVEFNPRQVGAYRLIGYENRLLRAEDFRDDRKDAGVIGAGHTVTAFYELVPPGKESDLPKVDPLKYQQASTPVEIAGTNETLTVKVRYKQPQAETSEPLNVPVSDSGKPLKDASAEFRFATAVACWGMLLRESEHKGIATHDMVIKLAQDARGRDPSGYRGEFVRLVELSKTLSGSPLRRQLSRSEE
jgi:Ca-activated chloride channel family protein